MDPTIVFLHIPKTGGTSLRALFEDRYPGERLLRVYRSGPQPRVEPDAFPALPESDRAKADAVFGHVAYGIHRHLPRPSRYVTVLRDPVERVVSHYYLHARRLDKGKGTGAPLEQAIASGRVTLADFARGDLPGSRRRTTPPPSQNLMTRFVSGHFPDCPTTPHDPALLEEAERNLAEHFLAVGLTENLPRFVELLSEQLAWGSRAGLEHRNVNPRRPAREDLDRETIAAIEESNALDLRLYEHVAALTGGGTRLWPGVGAGPHRLAGK